MIPYVVLLYLILLYFGHCFQYRYIGLKRTLRLEFKKNDHRNKFPKHRYCYYCVKLFQLFFGPLYYGAITMKMYNAQLNNNFNIKTKTIWYYTIAVFCILQSSEKWFSLAVFDHNVNWKFQHRLINIENNVNFQAICSVVHSFAIFIITMFKLFFCCCFWITVRISRYVRAGVQFDRVFFADEIESIKYSGCT